MIEKILINGFSDVQKIMAEARKKYESISEEDEDKVAESVIANSNRLMQEAIQVTQQEAQKLADPNARMDLKRIEGLQNKLSNFANDIFKKLDGYKDANTK